MRTRAQELSVGVFVVLALAALFFLAMRVSGLVSMFSNQDSYEVTAHFQNIGGLSPRAKVTLSGVTIGSVKSIELDKKRLDAKVTLAIDSDVTEISTDSYASIRTAGLLGEQFIGIDPGADETYLKAGSEITQTQSAMVLEDLINKFVFNKTAEASNETASDTKSTAKSDKDDSFGDF